MTSERFLTYENLTEKNFGAPKSAPNKVLQDVTRPHIESFNFMLHEGLDKAVQNLLPTEFSLPNDDKISLTITDVNIGKPMVASGNSHARTMHRYPAECREGSTSYKAPLQVRISFQVNGEVAGTFDREIASVPVMVKSTVCNLKDLTPEELVKRGEEAEEMGGYFIVNGNEKLIRMIILQRRNHALCFKRPSWKGRGPLYTEFGISMRCVREDHYGTNNVLHYLSNGTTTMCFGLLKELFFVPVILIMKALVNKSDKYIYDELVKGRETDTFYKGCIVYMLRQALDEDLTSQRKVLKYIGQRFRVKCYLPDWYTDEAVGKYLLKQCICIHLDSPVDKFNILVYMTRKLFSFVKGECAVEHQDNPMNHEILMGGHLYMMLLKEQLEVWLQSLKFSVVRCRELKTKEKSFKLTESCLRDCCGRTKDIGKSMEYFLATGNLVSPSGLGIMQNSGLVISADKLNWMRYVSHFRSVHRGSFFQEMRTTAVRKLLPECWGFLCPVHTPDGSLCGLLNHMTASCQVVTSQIKTAHLVNTLLVLGVTECGSPPPGPYSDCCTVLLDGKLIGYILNRNAKELTDKLRVMKVQGINKVPVITEICYVPKTEFASQYPGIYLFTGPARMMRPVQNLALNATEMIGTFEQVFLDICVNRDGFKKSVTTHQELSESSILSIAACLTPFSDFNQSPRNMYQCQMGKQTMGFPLHAFQHRSDNKLYRILTPQSPMVRPAAYDLYDCDNYPLGTNAVVAVISYTGYDMEDAMVINKSSYERGFAHGIVIKSEIIDLKQRNTDLHGSSLIFSCNKNHKHVKEGNLDVDGLPPVGIYLERGSPYYSYTNTQTGELRVIYYRSDEAAYVDHIKIIGDDQGFTELYKVCFVLRIPRNPTIGDKFSSRHGQKGICSILWPAHDMPFTESGMTPDIIFNPHGLPSRMTVGMMIEFMAGKSAALHGVCHDATPFTFSEDRPAHDYFGEMLTKAGYNYQGTERMYSGVDGRELEADIFFGIVYYQRLRHMVSDKFQVRSTGPIDQRTHQPIKGRKRGGGIRFGEMERDALISHGTSFLLEDRLLNCSDKTTTHICTNCCSILSPLIEKAPLATAAVTVESKRRWRCRTCKREDCIQLITVPYVFRYLIAELATMSIKVEIKVKGT